jgi:hypothetical protein
LLKLAASPWCKSRSDQEQLPSPPSFLIISSWQRSSASLKGQSCIGFPHQYFHPWTACCRADPRLNSKGSAPPFVMPRYPFRRLDNKGSQCSATLALTIFCFLSNPALCSHFGNFLLPCLILIWHIAYASDNIKRLPPSITKGIRV